jgi:imidazolonepropionase-like amidohydrolase
MPLPLFAALVAAALPAHHPPAAPPPLVIAHVTVIDATGADARPDMTVVLGGRRIAALGPAREVAVPRGAHVIDGSGKFLIPGLWDMHGHLTDATAAAFPLLVENGITGVRDMGGDLDQIDRWRAEIARGARLGPLIVRAGPFVDGPKDATNRLTVTDPAGARHAVDSLKARGVDFIKVHNLLPRDAFFALLREARNVGLPVAVHLPKDISSAEASDSGARSLEHIETLIESALFRKDATAKTWDEAYAAGAALFATFVRNGTWYDPTLVAYYRGFALWGSDTRKLGIRRTAFLKLMTLAADMHRAGVRMLAGSDFTEGSVGIQPGADLHEELAFLVEAGLSPMEALQAATLNPATFLGARDSLGTIEPGKRADLVLLDASPLENINNTRTIRAVVIGGQLVEVAAQRARLMGPAAAEEAGRTRAP